MLSLLRYLGVVYAEKPNTSIYLACVYLACVVGQGRQFNELKNIDSSSCQVVLLGFMGGLGIGHYLGITIGQCLHLLTYILL